MFGSKTGEGNTFCFPEQSSEEAQRWMYQIGSNVQSYETPMSEGLDRPAFKVLSK